MLRQVGIVTKKLLSIDSELNTLARSMVYTVIPFIAMYVVHSVSDHLVTQDLGSVCKAPSYVKLYSNQQPLSGKWSPN